MAERAETYIIKCPECGAANRIPANRVGTTAKCGKCRQELETDERSAQPEENFKMRCTECGAKNRVPGAKLNAGAKCGKCGAMLKTAELFTPQPIMISGIASIGKNVSFDIAFIRFLIKPV